MTISSTISTIAITITLTLTRTLTITIAITPTPTSHRRRGGNRIFQVFAAAENSTNTIPARNWRQLDGNRILEIFVS